MRPCRIVPLIALLAACAGGDSASDEAASPASELRREQTAELADPGLAARFPEPAMAPEAGSAEPPMPAQQAVTLDPMLIRTGRATVQVDSLERGIAAVRVLAGRNGGIVGAMNVSAGEQQARHATLEVRIPSERFDSALVGLAPIGRVEGVDVTAEDVGEEYADVAARVANARRLEARLLELLERRTGGLEEMLQVEREIARVREQVERYEGRLRYLRSRASVSVLTVTLREPQALIATRPGEQPLRDAVRQAWRSFIGLVAGLIAASGLLIPLALLAFALWRGLRALRRRDAAADAAYRAHLRRDREAAEEERPGSAV